MSSPFDLKLDNDEDHPRRLLKLGNHILAYGGDDGTISLITDDDDNNNKKARPVRRWDDDAVRAVAASDDGKRIAIGLDCGATLIYAYDDYRRTTDETHPFVGTLPEPKESQEDNLLSQSDTTLLPQQLDHETVYAGPHLDSPVRDLKFYPNQYYLGIASESGLCIIDVTSKESIGTRYLEEKAKEEHDDGGIRGLAFHQFQDTTVLAS